MKSPSAVWLACVVTALVPSVMGCAEEDAEGREPVYPVGTTAPASHADQAAYVAASPDTPPPPPDDPETLSPEVVVGGEDDEATPEDPGYSDAPPPSPVADNDPSALTDFRGALDPYGTWVDDPTYGTVWVPSPSAVGSDFTPYVSAGHWAYDNSDYEWVSDYSWGWAPFHYGRWARAAGPGWEWIPGRQYAGAWVSWRYGLDDWAYVGWAPLAPAWGWRGGAAVGLGFAAPSQYAFVPTGDLFARGIRSRVVLGSRAGVIAAHTRAWTGAPAAVSVAGGGGGRVLAHPTVNGPPPSTLGIPQSDVLRAGGNTGVAQARAFARLGGVAGSSASVSVRPGQRSTTALASGVAPAYGPPAASHFGGRLGGGFTGSPSSARAVPSTARPYYGSSPQSAPYYGRWSGRSAAAEAGARPYFGPSRSVSGPRYAGPTAAAPAAAAPSMPEARGFAGGGAAAATGGSHVGGGYSGGSHMGGVSRGGGGRAGGHR